MQMQWITWLKEAFRFAFYSTKFPLFVWFFLPGGKVAIKHNRFEITMHFENCYKTNKQTHNIDQKLPFCHTQCSLVAMFLIRLNGLNLRLIPFGQCNSNVHWLLRLPIFFSHWMKFKRDRVIVWCYQKWIQ